MLVGVYIRDFMPFGEVEFEPAEDELLLIYGGNGVGKSALFEAVYWSLTGTTVRGVPAINVLRHGTKSCEVTSAWLLDDVVVHVTRYKSKSENRITLEIGDDVQEFHTAADAQRKIDELFGDPTLLSLVAFFGRKFTTFSRMSARDRADLIDVLAKAQLWEDARAEAASDVSIYRRDLGASKDDRDTATKALAEEREKLTEAEAKLKAARREQQTQLTELRKRERELKKELGEAEKAAGAAESAAKALEGKRTKDEKAIKALEAKLREKSTEVSKLDGMISGLELPEEDDCPTCGQRIGQKLRQSIEKSIETMQEQRDAKATEHDDLLAKITEAEEKTRAARENLRDLNQTERDRRRDETESREGLRSVQRRIERAKSDDDVTRLEERVEILSTDSVPMWEKKLAAAEKDYREGAELLELAEFWATGFKQIRFLAMARVAGLLSTLMSRSVQALGFDVDGLECSVWKEGTRKGATRPEVNLIVRRGEWEDPIEALSEGETQRVDLACYLAIGQLVKAIEGYDPGLRVLDEPLAGMDDDGKFRTFQLLAEQLEGQRFVIDHDANFADLFREAIEVEHDGETASIRAV